MKRKNSVREMRAVLLMMFGGGLLLPGLAIAQIEQVDPAPAATAEPAPEGAAPAEAPAEVAQAEPEAEADEIETVIVKSRVNREVNILNNERIESVFGFDKTIQETPRSLTSISNETLSKLNITEIDDLVALSPGSFTQSFFGVAGSLDVRGSPGETYFRGIRRIENPGNYPTPIGASDRIDIVRGPASPIYGPSKIGGYLNFVPKSARAKDGAFSKKSYGEFGVTKGSWEKNVLHGEVGGPGKFAGKDFGYYLYAEVEDSDSYYENTSTNQNLYQASLDMQLSEKSRIEFGGLYQDFDGNQVAGWNRLTQDLIDNGTYITGSPVSLDTNGDGLLSAAESASGGLGIFYPFDSSGFPGIPFGDVGAQSAETVLADLAARPNMRLVNPGTAKLKHSQVLVQPDDVLASKVTTLYFDFIHDFDGGVKLTNKSFYEKLENINQNAYGFSQFADTYVFEDQLIFSFKTQHGENIEASYQLSPSVRYQDFEHGDNFDFEYFDRRDLTKPGSPIDRRTLSTRDGPLLEPYSSHTTGSYTDLGAAVLADYKFFESLNLLAGLRYDSIDVESTCGELLIPNADPALNVFDSAGCGDIAGVKQSATDEAFSWTGSLSYDIKALGLIPYVTLAKQATLVLGQGGEVPAASVAGDTFVADSDLEEYGVKGSFLEERLYASLAYFKQERTDFNAQDLVTNSSTESKGYEFEFRGVVTNNLALTGAYTNLEVTNLVAASSGVQFSFAGGGDLPDGVDPSLIYGGVVNGLVVGTNGRKAGQPEQIYSVYLIYNFDKGVLTGLTATAGLTHVDSVISGYSGAVTLPSYTLLNAGLNYETQQWKLGFQVKNLTDEEYFRSNFPDLFGSSVVLPETPRNYLATVTYKF